MSGVRDNGGVYHIRTSVSVTGSDVIADAPTCESVALTSQPYGHYRILLPVRCRDMDMHLWNRSCNNKKQNIDSDCCVQVYNKLGSVAFV